MNVIQFSAAYRILIIWSSLGGISALNRTIRQTRCSDDQFLCRKGDCISISDVCNGLSQCNDNSDEVPTLCDCGSRAAIGNVGKEPLGAHEAPPGAQPWFVGIYKVQPNGQHSLICSGTLIFDDIVLTSANCIIDPYTRNIYPTNLLRITVGKLNRDYNIDESIQQKLNVMKIVKRINFIGARTNYHQNLGIILLEQSVMKTKFVWPACLWTQRLYPDDRKGTIAGWGLKSTRVSEVNLMETSVGLIDLSTCALRFFSLRKLNYFTRDKFCVTFDKGVAINENLIGGPVTILHEGRYYIVGVLSVQPQNMNYGVATRIDRYLEWIKKNVYDLKKSKKKDRDDSSDKAPFLTTAKPSEKLDEDRFHCTDKSCTDKPRTTNQPAVIENDVSCEIPEGSEIFKASNCGDSLGCKNKFYAPTNSVYEITCPNGRGFAKPGVTNMSAVCLHGQWIPDLKESKCLKLCSPQKYKSLELDCQYQGSHVDCNEMMRPGTVIKVQCKRQFKKQILTTYAEQTTCRKDGTLEHDISTECIPVCGVPYDNKVQILISKGNKTIYAKYPWHTGLYWKNEIEAGVFEFRYQCGGTLIDSNKVLTAGHCIWESGGNVKDPSDIVVTFGKYYSSWNLKEDLEQRHNVSKIIPGKHYNGAATKYSQDIAVLILTKDVVLSGYVMPACLDLNGNFGGVPKNQLGHVIGWGRLSEKETMTSPVLMEAYVEYLDLDSCRERFNRFDFNEYLQSDKVCIAHRNGSGTQIGDSGGGLTFTHDTHHYIYGVVSIKRSGQDEFAVLTNVMYHASWISDILKHY